MAESKPFWSYWQKTALLWVPQHDPAMAATTFFYHGRHSAPLLWPPQQASAMVACPAMAAIACLCHYSAIAPQHAFTMGATAHLCHGRHSMPSPWLPQHASAMAAMARLCHDRHSTPLSWPPWHASAMSDRCRLARLYHGRHGTPLPWPPQHASSIQPFFHGPYFDHTKKLCN